MKYTSANRLQHNQYQFFLRFQAVSTLQNSKKCSSLYKIYSQDNVRLPADYFLLLPAITRKLLDITLYSSMYVQRAWVSEICRLSSDWCSNALSSFYSIFTHFLLIITDRTKVNLSTDTSWKGGPLVLCLQLTSFLFDHFLAKVWFMELPKSGRNASNVP